jgi:hypothetical protein
MKYLPRAVCDDLIVLGTRARHEIPTIRLDHAEYGIVLSIQLFKGWFFNN